MQHSINDSLSILANSEWLFFFDCIIILANCNNNNSGGTKLRQAIDKAIKDIRLIPKGLVNTFVKGLSCNCEQGLAIRIFLISQ